MEESEQCYANLINHHEDTVRKMLTAHDELVKATNELIKQTLIWHEKKIQCLEREINSKDSKNLMMQQFLVKFIQFTQHFVDIPKYKFDEVPLILEDALDTFKDQSHTADTYDNLSKMVNLIFQKVFDKLGEFKDDMKLALKSRPSNARGGEVVMT
ncbi:unnamed protein product [Lactuca virosa]|uniref:Uncharacterized protein n=1 Tax=Lactuca virosa TaxID=75947 RepID=A0AAU9PQ81_9ASTR|nr:unnamed protein product [Lactuca virosa]